jgi:hypothetical protein
MTLNARKPIFRAVQGDGQKWRVEAGWHDGTIEQIETFKSRFEAANWVWARSEAWLLERA